ncbi:MAG: hypothetical protein WC740_07015 [Verrucomicrobiia bacterium]
MLKYLLLLVVSCGLSLALTPLVKKLAVRIGAVDIPNGRKVHEHPIPRLGGVAIFAAFNLTMLLLVSPFGVLHDPFMRVANHWWVGFLTASAIVIGVGILDDLRPLSVGLKFLVQVIAALVAVCHGYKIEQIGLSGDLLWNLGLWSIPVTVLWIVGITNAFNLIDGLDGLASGVALISTLTLAGIALLNQHIELALISSALAGSVLGFMRYNFRPASIFLGDSGSLFLGFTLAVMSISTAYKSSATASILIPLLAFGLPIMDTALAMIRRFLRVTHVVDTSQQGKLRFFYLRGRSVFEADRDHVHHRLMKLGINHRNAVLTLYGVSAAAGCAALLVSAVRDVNTALVLLLGGGAACVAIQKLRYHELQLLRRGVFLPAMKQRVMGYESFQILVDMVIVSGAYYLAWLIRGEGSFEPACKASFIRSVPWLLLSQLAVFYVTGLYRIKWQHASIPDLLHVIRSIVLGFIAGMTVIYYFLPGSFSLSVLIIHFFVMSSFVLGARFSLRVLDYYAQKDTAGVRRVLIYGAGRAGGMLLREIQSNKEHALTVVGFIDDDLNKQEKRFYGHPILGTGSDAEDVIRKTGVQELIVAVSDMSDDRLAQLRQYCAQNRITLRRFQVTLQAIGGIPEVTQPVDSNT